MVKVGPRQRFTGISEQRAVLRDPIVDISAAELDPQGARHRRFRPAAVRTGVLVSVTP